MYHETFKRLHILLEIYPEEILIQHHTSTVEINTLIRGVIWGPASKVSHLQRILPGPSKVCVVRGLCGQNEIYLLPLMSTIRQTYEPSLLACQLSLYSCYSFLNI